MGQLIREQLDYNVVDATIREFPDGESYVRIHSPVNGKSVIIITCLNNPNPNLLPLLFFANKAKELGAASVCLVTTYLPYMRQDQEFKPGESVTSRVFASLLSRYVDHLITIDPHLHRVDSLDELYSIPTQSLSSAPLLSEWININVENPLVIGPDSESKQWVQEVARIAQVPFTVFQKIRHGDNQVNLKLSNLSDFKNYTPVLVDDIISTAGTMIKAVELLKTKMDKAPVCMGIHGVFSDNSFQSLSSSGVSLIVTTNTIPHTTNRIDISSLLVSGIRKYVSC
jgi:ribose-phosphate pyrophosphokinase